MSNEEEAAVLGRMVMEYGEIDQSLTLQEAEAVRVGRYLGEASNSLIAFQSLSVRNSGNSNGRVDLSIFPTAEQIQSMVDQIATARRRKSEHRWIAEAGRIRTKGLKSTD